MAPTGAQDVSRQVAVRQNGQLLLDLGLVFFLLAVKDTAKRALLPPLLGWLKGKSTFLEHFNKNEGRNGMERVDILQ